jgi:hypothetical protein
MHGVPALGKILRHNEKIEVTIRTLPAKAKYINACRVILPGLLWKMRIKDGLLKKIYCILTINRFVPWAGKPCARDRMPPGVRDKPED